MSFREFAIKWHENGFIRTRIVTFEHARRLTKGWTIKEGFFGGAKAEVVYRTISDWSPVEIYPPNDEVSNVKPS